MAQETEQTCPHEPRYREYFREGLYKCWECRKIIDDGVARVGNDGFMFDYGSTIPPINDSLEEFKMYVNKLSYIANHLGINNSFDRTLARNTIDEVTIAFNTYIKTLTNG